MNWLLKVIIECLPVSLPSLVKFRSASDNVNKMSLQLNNTVSNINHDLSYGKGPMNTLLHDSVMSQRLNSSIANIQKGTTDLDQIVEALKHNFLVRGYFKTQAKKQKQDSVNRQGLK